MLKNILSQTAFWQVNKKIAKEVGLEAACLLSHFIDLQTYFGDRDMLEDVFGIVYFFATSDKIEEATTLTYKKQKLAINILIDKGFVKIKLMKVPAKLHFTICEDAVWDCLHESGKTSIARMAKLECIEQQNLVVSNSKTINNNRDKDNRDNNISKDAIIKSELKDAIDNIYKAYPTKCPVKGSYTNKAAGNKVKISGLLKKGTYTEKELLGIIKRYVTDCKKSNTYMKNFGTFLNNIPDYTEIEAEEIEEANKINLDDYIIPSAEFFDLTDDEIIINCENGKYKKKVRCK